VQLLRAALLDLGQPGDELVAATHEVAERQQARDAAAPGQDVRVEATAGAGLQVVDDRDGELLLEPGDLTAQGAARGVLVPIEVATGQRWRDGRTDERDGVDDRVARGPGLRGLTHQHPLHVACHRFTVTPGAGRVDREPTPYVTRVRSDARRPGTVPHRAPGRDARAPRAPGRLRRSAGACGRC
jgi:hypothetical protein